MSVHYHAFKLNNQEFKGLFKYYLTATRITQNVMICSNEECINGRFFIYSKTAMEIVS